MAARMEQRQTDTLRVQSERRYEIYKGKSAVKSNSMISLKSSHSDFELQPDLNPKWNGQERHLGAPRDIYQTRSGSAP